MKYIIILTCLFLSKLGFAQEFEKDKVIQMDAYNFSEWANGLTVSLIKNDSINIEEIITERLRRNIFSTSQSILTMAELYAISKNKTANCIEFYDKLLSYVNDRQLLVLKLSAMRIKCLEESDEPRVLDSLYADLVQKIEKMEFGLLVQKFETSIKLGHLLLKKGQIDQAEGFFIKVLNYPWYTIDNHEVKSDIALLYVEAGKGIIECRKNSPELLERTFFFPAARPILDPIRDKALRKAKAEKK